MELWDIWCFLSVSFARQLHLEALTVNAPPPPLMYPLPGGFILDSHVRNELAESAVSFQGASRRYSMKSMTSSFARSALSGSGLASLFGLKKTPLWLVKLPHLVFHAALGLFNDYIFHQPTIVFVWVFISLNFSHFFTWYNKTLSLIDIQLDMTNAAASIFGWLFLVRGSARAPHSLLGRLRINCH